LIEKKLRRLEGKESQAAKEAWEKAEAERINAIKKREKELEKKLLKIKYWNKSV